MKFDFNVLQRFANIRASGTQEHPSVNRRIMAFSIDLFITTFVRVIILTVIKYLFKYKIVGENSTIFSTIIAVVFLSLGIVYRLFFMLKHHRTVGMMLMQFKLYAMPLNYLSNLRIIIREFSVSILHLLGILIFLAVKFNHVMIAITIALIIFLWIEMQMATKRRQFFHDFITNTQLLRV